MKKIQLPVLLATLKNFIGRVPEVQRAQLNWQVDSIVKRHKDNSQTLIKQLDMKLKFYQLAFPKVQIPQQQDPQGFKADLQFELNQEGVFKQKEVAEPQPQGNVFHVEKGQILQGQGKKIEKSIMNWYAGNADPEELQRHRKQLARMNFKDPVIWPKGRPKTNLQVKFQAEYQEQVCDIQAPQAVQAKNQFKNIKR